MLNKSLFVITLALAFSFNIGAALADEAVFSSNTNSETQVVDIKPANDTVITGEASKTETAGSFSDEKFKNAVNNLESAQVDIREQLAASKTKVDLKTEELNERKAELSVLKKEYRALEKKMKNIEKMKKMLNSNIGTTVAQ